MRLLSGAWGMARPLAMGDALPGLGEVLPPRSVELDDFVWGIDPSTLRVACAVVRRGLEGWDTLSLPKGDLVPRLAGSHSVLARWFVELAERWPPAVVWIEEPFGHGRAKVHPNSERTFGVVLAALSFGVGRGTPVEFVSPSSWKAGAMGKGNGFATKDRVMSWARAGGYSGALEDEADAVGIATHGALLRERSRRAA